MSTIVLEHLQHANSASPDLTVDSSGRIGIGTTTPSATLEINPASGGSELKITSTDNGGNNLRLIQGYNTYLNASNNVYMSAGGNTDMFNLVNGKVGIGTTGPGSHLHVGNIDNTIKTAYFDSPGSGDLDTVTIARGWGSHKGSGLHISGANYTNGTNTDAAMIQLNAATYGGENTRYMHMYDSGGTDFIFRGDGIFQAPNQPMFVARLNTNHLQPSGVYSVDGSFTAVFNIGNHYNATTRRFTAPVNGTYHFDCIVGSVGGAGTVNYLSAELWVNGARSCIGAWEGSGSPSYIGSSQSFTYYMNAGDYAVLGCEVNKDITLQSGSSVHTSFSGYLVG